MSAILGALMACNGGAAQADEKNPKIGFSIDDLRLERWAGDRDYFSAEAEKLGAKVYVQSADASEQRIKKKVHTVLLPPVALIQAHIDILTKDGFYTQAQLK